MIGGSIFVILVFWISGSLQQFVPIIPKECESRGYCENVPNYPHEYVNKIIEQAIKILAAKHRSGKWYFVIDKFQTIIVRICVNVEAACGTDADIGIELDIDANRTQCVQRYIEDFRMTIDANGILGERLLLTAVCCTCAVIAKKKDISS